MTEQELRDRIATAYMQTFGHRPSDQLVENLIAQGRAESGQLIAVGPTLGQWAPIGEHGYESGGLVITPDR